MDREHADHVVNGPIAIRLERTADGADQHVETPMPPLKMPNAIRVLARNSMPAPPSNGNDGHPAVRPPVSAGAAAPDSRQSSTPGFANHTRGSEETDAPARNVAPSHARARCTGSDAPSKPPAERAQPCG